MKSFVKNYGWREKQGEIFLKKGKSNVLKLHSAKKLLTLSKRQFLLLPSCLSAHLVFRFKGALQALATPAAQRRV